MVLGSAENPSQALTLTISAKKFDEIPFAAAIKQVTAFMRNQISSPDLQSFSRVTVLPGSDPFVQSITSALSADGGGMTLQNCNINGIQIDHAVLYKAARAG